jgi:hypothetical protein
MRARHLRLRQVFVPGAGFPFVGYRVVCSLTATSVPHTTVLAAPSYLVQWFLAAWRHTLGTIVTWQTVGVHTSLIMGYHYPRFPYEWLRARFVCSNNSPEHDTVRETLQASTSLMSLRSWSRETGCRRVATSKPYLSRQHNVRNEYLNDKTV